MGLHKSTLGFNLNGLLELSDWNLENSIDFYLNNLSEIESIFPKINSSSLSQYSSSSSSSNIILSCGHVEANFPFDNLNNMINIINSIINGSLSPSYKDGEYFEFSKDNITIIVSSKQIKNISGL
jgi:hypothetical protein